MDSNIYELMAWRMLRMALYKGKEGRWITTETGRHIFIENGKDPKEVIEELFEWDKEEKFDDEEMDLNVNESVNIRKVTVQKSSSYWGYDHDIRKERSFIRGHRLWRRGTYHLYDRGTHGRGYNLGTLLYEKAQMRFVGEFQNYLIALI